MHLGADMSIAGGVENAVLRGHSVGCEAIAMFTKNNNQWKAKPLTKEDADRFNAALVKTGIRPVVAHTSYLINLGSPVAALWKKSIASMEDELKRVNFSAFRTSSCIPARTWARAWTGASNALPRRSIAFTRNCPVCA